MRIVEFEAKSILTPSKLPDADYVANPYTGCAFACQYCYASFMGRYAGESIEDWGEYVHVKTNAVQLLEADLARLERTDRQGSILLSSVTDAWQGVEKKYRLTRGMIELLARERYPGLISILTKSPLVLDDIDRLKTLQRVEVGVTITTTDDALSRLLESRAPLASRRLKMLKRLNEAGLSTYAFVGPLLPHFAMKPELLDKLFAQIAEAGTTDIYCEQINLSAYIRQRLDGAIEKLDPSLRAAYSVADERDHRQRLEALVEQLMPKHGLRLRMGRVLDHRKDASEASGGSISA
jgi:DNA repair photolyase